MEGILLLIVIGLISKYFYKIKEYAEEKGFGQPGMPPFPKGGPIYKAETYDDPYADDYDEDNYDNYEDRDDDYGNKYKKETTIVENQSKIVDMEKADHLVLDDKSKTSSVNQVSAAKNQVIRESENDDIGIYQDDLFAVENIKKGIIWQEILEEPRARRPYRRL